MKSRPPTPEYYVSWHGASWRDDYRPLPAPKLDLTGRPVGGLYVSDANATLSGHFAKDEDDTA